MRNNDKSNITIIFQVQVQDEGANGTLLDCIMGVSADTVVFVEDSTRQIVLVLPTTSLLGNLKSMLRHYFISYIIVTITYSPLFMNDACLSSDL